MLTERVPDTNTIVPKKPKIKIVYPPDLTKLISDQLGIPEPKAFETLNQITQTKD
jgi:hypothetical protein